MDDKILVKTILDTEIDVLEGFLDKDRERVLLADSLYVSISDLEQLKGHLDTLKKMRETGWRNWQTMKNNVDIDTTTVQPMELEYQGRKFENYPGQIENLVKERDNWRKMYDEELKKNEDLTRINSVRGDEIDRLRQKRTGLELENDELKTKLSWNEEMLSSRYSDIARLKKENDELSRINSARLGDINRLQDKVDKLDSLIEPYDWKTMTERALLASIVYFTLKPMFEIDVLNDRIDLRDSGGLLIIFAKDNSTLFPRLIMEITKFHKSGKTEMIARDCFGMDCGLEVVTNAVTSMIFEHIKHVETKKGEPDDNKNS